ncbi:hypothetical protein CJU90_6643 [Yarrowia sp. C11]|nr:hypothetical protein CJU90_6643 [Yarrowia sp. C11]KAG5358749.1 hypothetical protein CKK34_5022 [Yarrowia sp. E02]
MRDTHARFDTQTRYSGRYPENQPVKRDTKRIPSGFAKDTSMRKVLAQNLLKMRFQTQNFGTVTQTPPPIRVTPVKVAPIAAPKTRDFLSWFDEVWEGANKWKFDDTWREFDHSWGQYTEKRLLLRVR